MPSKLSFNDIKQLIKTYSDNSLKKYKNILLNDFKKSFNYDKKEKITKFIDIVTLELVSRNLNMTKINNNKHNNSSHNRSSKKSKKVRQRSPQKLIDSKKHISNLGMQIYSKTSSIHKKKNTREIEKKRDASSDFYNYREYGKFGSHSSYDDHGDESFA